MVFTGGMQGRFGTLLQFINRQDHLDVEMMVEVFADTDHFFLGIGSDGAGDFNLMSGDEQLHGDLLRGLAIPS
jgi:hypothetical protein